jgi:DNA-binding MarR family transcriptional regulator
VPAPIKQSDRSGDAARRRLATADYQALGAFRHALRRFLAFSENGSRSLGLTPQQHQALLAVRAHEGPEPMTVGELAVSLMIKNHSALGLVDRLVERGLLVRGPSTVDRRRVVLRLTDTGRRKLESISRNNLGQLKTSLPVFTDLLEALERLELPGEAEQAAPAAPKRRAKR